MKTDLKTHLGNILDIDSMSIVLPENEILEILKRRLTKKEKKYFLCELEGFTLKEIEIKLNLDEKRAKEIKDALYTKLKHPKTRNEIVD